VRSCRLDSVPAGRAVIYVLLAAAATLAGAVGSMASGVDGAGRIVVIPLVVNGPERHSVITLTNAGAEPMRIGVLYVGADGTPAVGSRTCQDQSLAASGSLTLSLPDLCGLPSKPDAEDFGYLEMTSTGDSRLTFFATSRVETTSGVISAIPGQPIGAFGPASKLRVIGLRTFFHEPLVCDVATLSQDKELDISLRDNRTLFGQMHVVLPARHVMRIDARALGAPAHMDQLRVEIDSKDDSILVAGCILDHARTEAVAYHPAQTPEPSDVARLRSVDVHEELQEGPHPIGYPWDFKNKVVLSTYLRSNDNVQCFLAPTPIYTGFDPSPYLELQVRDPDGKVVAGGDGVKDTGVFRTGPRGRYAGQRWWIEISFDEATTWPKAQPYGGWGLRCDSAAGMSEPIAVDQAGNLDDF
jgi:hypothetical protein